MARTIYLKQLQPLRLVWLARHAWLSLLIFILAGCGAPDVQPLAFGATPWQDGEASTYRVIDVNGDYAGTTRFDLTNTASSESDAEANPEDVLWNLRREINTQGVQEIVTVDTRGLDFRPVASTLVRLDGANAEQVRTVYSGSQADLELTTRQNVTTYERVSIPSDARDQNTLLMIIRALPLAPDYATRLNTFLPIVPLLDRVTISVVDQEEVTVPAGTFDTYQVRLDTGNSRTVAWFGVDAPHPLVKYEDGRNGGTFELAEFQASQ